MAATVPVQEYLDHYLATHGEDAWKQEIKRLCLIAVKTSPQHVSFWRDLTKDYAWLDWSQLEKESAVSAKPEDLLADMLRNQIPGIKTKAQYETVLGALDSIRFVIGAILADNEAEEEVARKAMETALQALKLATVGGKILEETPEAATSKEAEDLRQESPEDAVLGTLLRDLAPITSARELTEWYNGTSPLRDSLKRQDLRNQLMDAIRAKKVALS